MQPVNNEITNLSSTFLGLFKYATIYRLNTSKNPMNFVWSLIGLRELDIMHLMQEWNSNVNGICFV